MEEEKIEEPKKRKPNCIKKPSPIDNMPERWIYLREACEMKGVAYNSLCRPKDDWRQPNCGKADGVLNGRKAWRPETIRQWITEDDSVLKKKQKAMITEEVRKALKKR